MLTKFFVGIRLTIELKEEELPAPFIRLPYEGKEYIGLYLESPQPTLAEVKEAEATLRNALPGTFRGECVVFPQPFLG